MLRLSKRIMPTIIQGFSKIKVNQFGVKTPAVGLKPAPGFKKPEIKQKITPHEPKNPESLLSKTFTISNKLQTQSQAQKADIRKKHAVVTVMGHVDHGKTTLIDYLRNSNIAEKEDGGITQRIGAFRINCNGERVTFIDTPGHQAFTNMRKRGAVMTDLIILIVSAVEGVKKQTLEVINLIKTLDIPVIVAISKIDLPQANPEEMEMEIDKAGLNLEPLGGSIPVVHISAKTGMNINLLCELITEETRNKTANFSGLVEASVLQASQTKEGLNSMTIIVEKGTLKTNDIIIVKKSSFKVKTILDDRGEVLKEAFPGQAVQIVGIPSIPSPGDQIFSVENEKKAHYILEQKRKEQFEESRESNPNKVDMRSSKINFEHSRAGRREKRAFCRGVREVWMNKFNDEEQKILTKIEELSQLEQTQVVQAARLQLQAKLKLHKEFVFEYLKNTGEQPNNLNFIIKFEDRGMEQTILMQLEQLKPQIEEETKVKLNLIKTDVGDVTLSDLQEAANCSAKIFTFGAGISHEARNNLSGMEAPRTHKLIHSLLHDIKQTSFNKKRESIKGVERGRCQVAEVYTLKIKKDEKIVPGINVISGKVNRKCRCYIYRNSIPISQPFSINFLKSFKKEMIELKKGEEGTIGFVEDLSGIGLQKGDEIVCFQDS